MINKYITSFLLAGFCLTLAPCLAGVSQAVPAGDELPRKESAREKRADRRFLGQNFRGALSLYRVALEKERDLEKKVALGLKVARLYFMVREYESAAHYFEMVEEMEGGLSQPDDICDYLDALCFLHERQKAEAICLHYAYESVYSNHQRYKNSLNALTMIYDTVLTDYTVRPLRLSSSGAEYWVGNFEGRPFYATSRSNFNAPGKLFFHRTRYRALNENLSQQHSDRTTRQRLSHYLADVPRELQCGPVSFSPGLDKMVATEIVYDSDERVHIENGRDLSLRTRLVYSDMSAGNRRFTKFQPIFRQEADASYAHPFLYNDGRSILFTSNMSGGYGGFDLYVAHWDEERQEWGYPVNLGPTVNSEGDEIFPTLFDGELYFSSNGHLGLGGYDLFRVLYADHAVVPNSLYHLPYPINTVFNDFHIYPLDDGSGYIASDRDRKKKDNLFYYHKSGEKNGPVDLDLTEQSRLNSDVSSEHVMLGNESGKALLSTVYFDFDKAALTSETMRDLKQLIRKHGISIEGLHVIGYADEVGEDTYNQRLSTRRAQTVADWLHLHGLYVPISVEGRGKLVLYENKNGRPRKGSKILELIEGNRRARRVEIYVEK